MFKPLKFPVPVTVLNKMWNVIRKGLDNEVFFFLFFFVSFHQTEETIFAKKNFSASVPR